jgi:hypothetical protein
MSKENKKEPVANTNQFLGQVSTKALTNTLVKREGISELIVEPYGKVTIVGCDKHKLVTGPARIIINYD